MIGKDSGMKKVEAVIDTGAAVLIMSPGLAAELGLAICTWGAINRVGEWTTDPTTGKSRGGGRNRRHYGGIKDVF
ncbi:hypothetical protein OUZ56_011521 [Daphnia magna]|uniref:Peptidase A2 domain-containing protein n=1 Tax=Daphnia magna TaxID=35525 RepID=A0ABQ9Z0G5_9CRUS|nr:hypothetical protein OUZ56_011521 [Daphnia magna]